MTYIDSISVDEEDKNDWMAVKMAFKRHKKSFSAWVVKLVLKNFVNGGWSEVFDTMEDLEKKE